MRLYKFRKIKLLELCKMKFKLIENTNEAIDGGFVYLIFDQWDDYGYCTTFIAYYNNNTIEN